MSNTLTLLDQEDQSKGLYDQINYMRVTERDLCGISGKIAYPNLTAFKQPKKQIYTENYIFSVSSPIPYSCHTHRIWHSYPTFFWIHVYSNLLSFLTESISDRNIVAAQMKNSPFTLAGTIAFCSAAGLEQLKTAAQKRNIVKSRPGGHNFPSRWLEWIQHSRTIKVQYSQS